MSAGRDQGAILEDDATPPSALASRRELTGVLELALQQITTRDRDLLTWREKEELTFDEMGQRLGISNVAARKAWYKAVEHLQEAMARLIPETFKSSHRQRHSPTIGNHDPGGPFSGTGADGPPAQARGLCGALVAAGATCVGVAGRA